MRASLLILSFASCVPAAVSSEIKLDDVVPQVNYLYLGPRTSNY